MKAPQRTLEGSALIIALVLTAVMGLALASYVSLVGHQSRSVARSLAWNQAMPVAESGIEEALTQIYYTGTNVPGNTWTLGSDGLYHKTRSVGSDGSYYSVSIQLSDPPVIVSKGSVFGGADDTTPINRSVRVITQKASSPAGGITCRGTIRLSGGAFLDSFDSADPNYSTNGLYTPAKRKANGQALSNAKCPGAVSLSGGAIYGYATTGPGGTTTASGSAQVGDLAWIASGSPGIQSGHNADDANVDFPAVQVPDLTGALAPASGSYNATNFDYLLGTGTYYSASRMNINGNQVMAVTGDAVLYVNDDFNTSGSAYVYIFPGASLKLYVSGSLSVAGGGIINGSQRASNLSVYGVNTTVKSWSYSGNSAFIGLVYAPNADMAFSGGAGASGAFTANSVTITGNSGVHYDEHLVGTRQGYVVARWIEL